MNDQELKIVVGARDNASAVIRKVQSQLDDSSSSMRRGLDRAREAADNFGPSLDISAKKAALMGAVAGATSQAVHGLASAFRAATAFSVNAYADFEQALNIFQSVSQATNEQMTAVAMQARALGKDISLPGVSSRDAALAMGELAKAGLSVNDTLAASKGVLSLAKAGQLDTAQAAAIAANALNAFSLRGQDAAAVADVLAAAANASSAGVGDLAFGLQMASASAASMKVPLEDTVAALGLMANNGIAGSDAGTSLKTMFAALTPVTDRQKDAMKKLNLDFFDAKGNFVGMVEVIRQLEKGTSKLTQEQKLQSLETIFGSDAVRAANILLKEGVSGFNEMGAAVRRSGAATELAAAQNKGLKGALDNLKSSAETLAIDFGEKLAPGITRVASFISQNLEPAARTAWNTFERVGERVADVASRVGDYLQPKLEALWNTITQDLAPALSNLWNNILVPFGEFVGTVLVGAFGLAVDAANIFFAAISPVIQWLADHESVVKMFAAAIAAMWTVMKARDGINAMKDGLDLVKGRLTDLDSFLTGFGGWATIAAAGVAAAVAIYDEWKKLNEEIAKAERAIANAAAGVGSYKDSLDKALREGRIDQGEYNRRWEAFKSSTAATADAIRGRATGGRVNAGEGYVVGEQRAEFFRPDVSGRIEPKAPQGGDVKNILSGTFNFYTAEAVDQFFAKIDRTQRLARQGMA